ncbi:hypothetical protein AGMMS49940_16700 [Spirochaetia bacterium]|nr:hypothetical protein AGMMS49940_16700 [Spirochaetia bacterium]
MADQGCPILGNIPTKNTGVSVQFRFNPLQGSQHRLQDQKYIYTEPYGMLIKGSGDTAMFRPDLRPGGFRRPDDGIFQEREYFPPGPAELRMESY